MKRMTTLLLAAALVTAALMAGACNKAAKEKQPPQQAKTVALAEQVPLEDMRANLTTFGKESLDWFSTPAARGGAGGKIGEQSIDHLAEWLEFISEPRTRIIEATDSLRVSYLLSEVTDSTATVTATPVDPRFDKGPLLTAVYNLRGKTVDITENSVYRR